MCYVLFKTIEEDCNIYYKYYTNNEFVANKGNMVVGKSPNEFNPF